MIALVHLLGNEDHLYSVSATSLLPPQQSQVLKTHYVSGVAAHGSGSSSMLILERLVPVRGIEHAAKCLLI